jgi:hypothetical protein
MSVRVEIKGRQYTLSWDEFERMMSRKPLTETVSILDIRSFGGGYVAA